MDHIVLLICLFPVVFMLHDFEEIIMQQRWMERNADELSRRFPVLRKQIMQLRELSTTGFAIAVAEEFIIISGVSVYAVLSQHYFLWMALFLAFGIHLLVHVGQFVLLRKYIPGYSNLIALSALCGLCLLFLLFYGLVYCNGFSIGRNIGCPYYGVESEIGSCVGAQAGCPHLIDQDALIPPTGLRIILCHPSLRISTK